jgi:uncharacterized membrane protein
VVSGAIVCLIAVATVAFVILRQPGIEPQARLLTEGSAVAGVTGGFSADVEAAGLRLCNRTSSRVGVAIGYKEDSDWTTEGWWNVSAGVCETLVAGSLVSRFYYVYALDYDQGGDWGGRATLCTRDKMFTIRGTQDCVARGFETSGFFEVDTGEQKSWTVQLTEPGQSDTGIGG